MSIEEGSGFDRQRRNVIVLSVALIVFELAGGSVDGQGLLGPLKLQRPELLHAVAYVALGYFVLRLFQWSRRERAEFHEMYWRELNDRRGLVDAVESIVTSEELLTLARQMFGPNSDPEGVRSHIQHGTMEPAGLFRRRFIVGHTVDDWKKRESALRSAVYRYSAVDQLDKPQFGVPARLWLWHELKTFSHLALTTEKVTELWLPYLLAAVAVVVAALR